MRAIQGQVLKEHEGLDPNPWSYEQTVAVALLASPLFSLICKLGVREAAGTTESCSCRDHYQHASVETMIRRTSMRSDSVELDSLVNETSNAEGGRGSNISSNRSFPQKPHVEEIGFLYQLISGEASTSFPWLAICRVVSCGLPVAVLAFANSRTNYRLWDATMSMAPFTPNESIFTFWFSASGMLGYVLLLYPCVGATKAVLGLRLDQIVRIRNKASWHKVVFSVLFLSLARPCSLSRSISGMVFLSTLACHTRFALGTDR